MLRILCVYVCVCVCVCVCVGGGGGGGCIKDTYICLKIFVLV